MHINRIYVDNVALAWSLADSVAAQRDALESSCSLSARRTDSRDHTPLVRLLRWLRKGGPGAGNTAKAGSVSAPRAPLASR